jgi:NlpC/P60 family putative phage cell wall peptidase
MTPLQQEILDEARSWIGTPFSHQGRIKGKRVDCIGLIEMIARAKHLIGFDETTPLPDRWTGYAHMPEHGELEKALSHFLIKQRCSQVQPCDIIAIRMPSDPTRVAKHVAIYTERDTIIHALALGKARKCTEHRYDRGWKKYARGVYRFPELCN